MSGAAGSLLTMFTLFAFSCGDLDARGLTYCLSFQNLQRAPNERLSKFDLHIKSSIIVAVPRVAPGWHIEIDNETNEMPTISGIAIEQAVDLEEREFATGCILVAGVPKDLLRSGSSGKISVEG
jgi:hypothetical protein